MAIVFLVAGLPDVEDVPRLDVGEQVDLSKGAPEAELRLDEDLGQPRSKEWLPITSEEIERHCDDRRSTELT
jgi:hypothetical protein